MISWKRFDRDALSFSAIFSILGCLSIALVCGRTARTVFSTVPPDDDGMKVDHSLFGTVSLIFSFFFSTLSMMSVSLVWIQIAANAEKLKPLKISNIMRYRNMLVIYYVCFMAAVCITLALNVPKVAAALILPGIIIVISTYVVGGLKMKRIMNDYLLSMTAPHTSQSAGPTVVNTTAVEKVRDSLHAVKYTAFGVSFWAGMFTFWMAIWTFTGGFEDRPGKDLNLIALAIAWFSAACSNAVVVWYLHVVISRKARTRSVVTDDAAILSNEHAIRKFTIIPRTSALNKHPSDLKSSPLKPAY
jgi:hypothetical protein